MKRCLHGAAVGEPPWGDTQPCLPSPGDASSSSEPHPRHGGALEAFQWALRGVRCLHVDVWGRMKTDTDDFDFAPFVEGQGGQIPGSTHFLGPRGRGLRLLHSTAYTADCGGYATPRVGETIGRSSSNLEPRPCYTISTLFETRAMPPSILKSVKHVPGLSHPPKPPQLRLGSYFLDPLLLGGVQI